jgi:hypothetical protein
MGQPVTWQYALVWTPDEHASKVELYRISSAGHRFLWAAASRGPQAKTPTLDDVHYELYYGLQEIMKKGAEAGQS